MGFIIAPSPTVDASAVGEAGNAGTSGAFSRGDHQHGREAYGASLFKAVVHRAGATGAQSIATGTATDLVMDTEDYDGNNNYNPATGIYTCPVNGTYLCAVSCRILGAVGDVVGTLYVLTLEKNGTQIATLFTKDIEVAGLANQFQIAGALPVVCVAGDTLNFAGFHTAGANRDFGGTSDTHMRGGFMLQV